MEELIERLDPMIIKDQEIFEEFIQSLLLRS